MKDFASDYKSWWKAFVATLAIGSIWYGLEFIQFGTLQWDRCCDNVVALIYYVLLAWLFHKSSNNK